MDILSYDARYFVDRDAEIALVQSKVRQIAQGEAVSTRTLTFRGERGTGKSWFCLHLKHTVLVGDPHVVPVFMNLTARSLSQRDYRVGEWSASRSDQTLEQKTADLLRYVGEQTGTALPNSGDLGELSYWLERTVKEDRSGRVVVLLVDSAYEADWDLLKLVETYLLAPLSGAPNVLIVITGRGKAYPWASPNLRLNATEFFFQPFDVQQVAEQIAHQCPEAAMYVDEIADTVGGHPLSVYLLAQNFGQPDTLDRVVKELLAVLPHGEYSTVRSYLEAVCVLDGFVEDDLPPMIAARLGNDEITSWSPAQVRKERDRLLESQLVRWHEGRFVIDGALQRALESFLRQEQHDLWRRLHERAAEIYLDRAERYPRHAGLYRARAGSHRRRLAEDRFAPVQEPATAHS